MSIQSICITFKDGTVVDMKCEITVDHMLRLLETILNRDAIKPTFQEEASSASEEFSEAEMIHLPEVQRRAESSPPKERKNEEQQEEKNSLAMVGYLSSPLCDYAMFYNLEEQVSEPQKRMIQQAWQEYGCLGLPSFASEDIYMVIFPKLGDGESTENVSSDPLVTTDHDIPLCSCPSYYYGKKKWFDTKKDQRRTGGCKHVFFLLDVLSMPRGIFMWEKKNIQKEEQCFRRVNLYEQDRA